MDAEDIALLALCVAGVNAIAQFGMFLVHCRGDKKRFRELSRGS